MTTEIIGAPTFGGGRLYLEPSGGWYAYTGPGIEWDDTPFQTTTFVGGDAFPAPEDYPGDPA